MSNDTLTLPADMAPPRPLSVATPEERECLRLYAAMGGDVEFRNTKCLSCGATYTSTQLETHCPKCVGPHLITKLHDPGWWPGPEYVWDEWRGPKGAWHRFPDAMSLHLTREQWEALRTELDRILGETKITLGAADTVLAALRTVIPAGIVDTNEALADRLGKEVKRAILLADNLAETERILERKRAECDELRDRLGGAK